MSGDQLPHSGQFPSWNFAPWNHHAAHSIPKIDSKWDCCSSTQIFAIGSTYSDKQSYLILGFVILLALTVPSIFYSDGYNDLAMAYFDCGLYMNSPGNSEQAGHYFMKAWQLGRELQQKFGDKMPDSWKNVFEESRQRCHQFGLLGDIDE